VSASVRRGRRRPPLVAFALELQMHCQSDMSTSDDALVAQVPNQIHPSPSEKENSAQRRCWPQGLIAQSCAEVLPRLLH
jgi:hypothetical protein